VTRSISRVSVCFRSTPSLNVLAILPLMPVHSTGGADGEVAVFDGGEGLEEKAGVDLTGGVVVRSVFGGHGVETLD